jgi:hypothetical protein
MYLLKNIFNLGPTDRLDNDNVRLIQDCVSKELAYASKHWASHFATASKFDDKADSEGHLKLFASKDILAWSEVLGVIGLVENAYPSLDRL